MKKVAVSVISILSLIIGPTPAFALFTVGQGGTGWGNFASGGLLYGNGTSPLATTSAGTLGYVLQFNGSIPTWVSTSSLGIVSTVVAGGSDKQIQFNDGGSFGGNAKLVFQKTYNGLA